MIIGCSCRESNNSNPSVEQIVISKENNVLKSKRDSILQVDSSAIFPPLSYYSRFNFIIDETSNIYFHNLHKSYNLDEPPLVSLKEEDVVILLYEDIKGFVDSIYESIDTSDWKLIQIASTTDTINMRSYRILNEQFDVKRKFAKTPLRFITNEEMEVLKKIKE